jgi:flavin reductase (DIM6/NTAB) family NADH-FMN oxidoreductase RutF
MVSVWTFVALFSLVLHENPNLFIGFFTSNSWQHLFDILRQVSTCSVSDSTSNLAPFSYFNIMSHSPAMIAIGVTRSDSKCRPDGRKDSLANIEETGQLVVNSMNKW